jgi:hypothetical protein
MFALLKIDNEGKGKAIHHKEQYDEKLKISWTEVPI